MRSGTGFFALTSNIILGGDHKQAIVSVRPDAAPFLALAIRAVLRWKPAKSASIIIPIGVCAHT